MRVSSIFGRCLLGFVVVFTWNIYLLDKLVAAPCPNNWAMPSAWKIAPIPVFINTLIDEDICPASSCNSFNDIRSTIEAGFNEYYNATAAQISFTFAETSVARGEVINGAIHIYSGTCSGGALGTASLNGGPGGTLKMCSSNEGVPIVWDTFHRAGSKRSFHSVLLQELGHILGMNHIGDCNDPTIASIMDGNYNSQVSEHLQRPDIKFMNVRYGPRSNIGHAKWTPDGSAWLNGGGLPAPFFVQVNSGRFAATNSMSSGNNVFVASADQFFNTVWVGKYTPSEWTFLTFDTGPTIYHPGVASRAEDEVFVTWLGKRDPITGKQDVLAREFSDVGDPISPIQILTDTITRTANAGVSATYDPESDSYIAIWRGSFGSERNTIMYRVVGQSPSPWKLQNPRNNEDVKAADTPSIACGPASVLGEDNCIVAWVDAFNWQRPVRWTQGHVTAGGQLELRPIKGHWYITTGSPSVAYWSEGNYPWIIALNQGGMTTYTWRKEASHEANFQTERQFSFRPKVTLPAAGSRQRGTPGRGYVFVTDP